MSIKAQSYLYPTADGVWMFQIFIPVYMRHIFGGKRLYRKSTGTMDLTAAKHSNTETSAHSRRWLNLLAPLRCFSHRWIV